MVKGIIAETMDVASWFMVGLPRPGGLLIDPIEQEK